MSDGPTLRRDLVTGHDVLIAPTRRGSPRDFGVASVVRDATACPFCPGRESTTAETRAERTDADGRWIARAFANRFPMVRVDALAPPPLHATGPTRPAVGDHEVIVETPDHDCDLAELSDPHARAVFDLYRERCRVMAARPEARAVAFFKNRGPRSGASLQHAHAQALSLPVSPPGVRRRDAVSRAHHRATGLGALADARDRELAAEVRVVERSERYAVFCPFAPHRSFETWVVPRFSSPSWRTLDDDALAELASLTLQTLRRVLKATGNADYNLVVREASLRNQREPWALWHLEILPRRGGDAGFELSSGLYCVLVPPEESAAALRAL